MYAWGSNIHGQLGLEGIHEDCILTPRLLNWNLANTVKDAALGESHTLFLTNDGKVYSCGSNEYGQLGYEQPKEARLNFNNHDQHRKRPQQVSRLNDRVIVGVACGSMHSMALDEWGQVFSWGSDYFGQLAQQKREEIQYKPRIIRALATYHIVQICCGHRHSLALANTGEIFAWGANNFGQLGIGNFSSMELTPRIISGLNGLPIALIVCGAYHSFAISKSGAVYGWGKSSRGQVGLNEIANKAYPCQLRNLRSLNVKYIACGEEFSTFLTVDGRVFTCGSGRFGQLGHGSTSNTLVPRQVQELMGSTISQVVCGSQHSLAFVLSSRRLFSYGIGGSGQLGLDEAVNGMTPQIVSGPWLQPVVSVPSTSSKNENFKLHRIFAGGDHCFVSVKPQDSIEPPHDCRIRAPNTEILTIDRSYLRNLLDIDSEGIVDQEVLCFLETVFKSLSCLNGSFLLDDDKHSCCTTENPGVDTRKAAAAFTSIGRIGNNSIKNIIFSSIANLLLHLSDNPPDVETLRIYLTLPYYHEFNNPRHHIKIQTPFGDAVLKLHENPRKRVQIWWNQMDYDFYEKLINIYKSVVVYIIRNQHITTRERRTVYYDASLVTALNVLTFLFKINLENEMSTGLKVPYDAFTISEITDLLDVKVDYVLWLTEAIANRPDRLYMCDYPFIFDAQAKVTLLETDQAILMQNAMQNATREACLLLLSAPIISVFRINQFLLLNVTRDNIVEDTLRELSQARSLDLKKPLKVKFSGEEAEDAGGVTKEFFLLLCREILDPKYGMFKEYEETRAIWFAEKSFEDNEVYKLIGMILGLAIYNFIIIDIPFPLALYKKLLGHQIDLPDLKGLSPVVANSLQNLLDYEGDDFEQIFPFTFCITRDVFGEMVTTSLKEDGANIALTQENKFDYVKLYVDFIFNESVKDQFGAFHQGFTKVCGSRVLRLFHPHELMSVVVGNENYDWHALEEVAQYRNGYTSSSATIRWFWEVLHEMDLADKKKFLLFLTGSCRIPIQGMKAIKITIQPTNDERYLPAAHTCFNILDLPKYRTKERLKYKLMQAIQQTEGFSLV